VVTEAAAMLKGITYLGNAQWFLKLLPLLKDISYLGNAQWFLKLLPLLNVHLLPE
jgi:hypothetical protein